MSNGLVRFVETDLIQQLSYDQYRKRIRDIYGGLLGALLPAASQLSLHPLLVKRLIRSRKFDLHGCKLANHLLELADPEASIVCCDLSLAMLQRSRTILESHDPCYLCADLTELPFADDSFD